MPFVYSLIKLFQLKSNVRAQSNFMIVTWMVLCLMQAGKVVSRSGKRTVVLSTTFDMPQRTEKKKYLQFWVPDKVVEIHHVWWVSI